MRVLIHLNFCIVSDCLSNTKSLFLAYSNTSGILSKSSTWGSVPGALWPSPVRTGCLPHWQYICCPKNFPFSFLYWILSFQLPFSWFTPLFWQRLYYSSFLKSNAWERNFLRTWMSKNALFYPHIYNSLFGYIILGWK